MDQKTAHLLSQRIQRSQINMQEHRRKKDVLYSMQIALLGEIIPSIRAISVRFDLMSVHFICYVDGEFGQSLIESMQQVETEVLADFPTDNRVTHEIVRCDVPNDLPRESCLAYLRKESGMSH